MKTDVLKRMAFFSKFAVETKGAGYRIIEPNSRLAVEIYPEIDSVRYCVLDTYQCGYDSLTIDVDALEELKQFVKILQDAE